MKDAELEGMPTSELHAELRKARLREEELQSQVAALEDEVREFQEIWKIWKAGMDAAAMSLVISQQREAALEGKVEQLKLERKSFCQ